MVVDGLHGVDRAGPLSGETIGVTSQRLGRHRWRSLSFAPVRADPHSWSRLTIAWVSVGVYIAEGAEGHIGGVLRCRGCCSTPAVQVLWAATPWLCRPRTPRLGVLSPHSRANSCRIVPESGRKQTHTLFGLLSDFRRRCYSVPLSRADSSGIKAADQQCESTGSHIRVPDCAEITVNVSSHEANSPTQCICNANYSAP